tara:strand:+ start:666 stop:938 length:273 start_codon:yes stop_codon:yes gene_type:complete
MTNQKLTIKMEQFDQGNDAAQYAEKITKVIRRLGFDHLELIPNPEKYEQEYQGALYPSFSKPHYILVSQPTGEGLYLSDRVELDLKTAAG